MAVWTQENTREISIRFLTGRKDTHMVVVVMVVMVVALFVFVFVKCGVLWVLFV